MIISVQIDLPLSKVLVLLKKHKKTKSTSQIVREALWGMGEKILPRNILKSINENPKGA